MFWKLIYLTLIQLHIVSSIKLNRELLLKLLCNNATFFSLQEYVNLEICRSSHPEVLLENAVLKLCSKCTVENPCRIVISISNFIEITLRHGYSPVNLLHIFRTPFTKNTFRRLLLDMLSKGESESESWILSTAWKVSKYAVFSGPYFSAFGLNTERNGVWSISPYSVRMRENTDQKKPRTK